MLDRDLAAMLVGVSTSNLNEAVRANLWFPATLPS